MNRFTPHPWGNCTFHPAIMTGQPYSTTAVPINIILVPKGNWNEASHWNLDGPPCRFYVPMKQWASAGSTWKYDAESTPTCWHFESTRKGHWPWQLFSKGPQPSPKFPPVTLYSTHNCVIHSKDTISQPPFLTSPTKYRKSKLLDSSTVV
jgi:hypothetical protein